MHDEACVTFLQWALPRLRMRWPGFRKVRGQVCKRLQRHIKQLGLEDVSAYRRYLARHPEEWRVLDAITRVTISRFYRDKGVFARLVEEVLPELAQLARSRGADRLNVWSAGAGAGEEPYTLAIAWEMRLQPSFSDLRLRIVASDADANQCRRAREACYPPSNLKDLPAGWRGTAFTRRAENYCLKPEFRGNVEFRVEDIRESAPPGPFDLVLCRNLVFTYFDEELQRAVLERIGAVMQTGAALVLGIHEGLPEGTAAFRAWDEHQGIYRLNPTAAPD
ncbi:CheR family methyltransferase [Microbulbifer rhizosphaerae]|uniref:Chemotaxis protein methyltransferase CheR n=1 Tax=Microbulbifer rhizosphaerae TaxID=1562603 RepID=A0A7W4W9N1_9GAMM|nr:CheR family methyltransferase [Microbulbifer rhizosphaerae]MBB3060024.1 chemotaxis protein methyltransferase CheR [Microbulbifer rhizosphaerae]